nr:HPP family protein [Synechococcus sp. CCAP 1479/9]
MAWLLRLIQSQRRKGREYQPSFLPAQVLLSWFGALLAITLLGLISVASHYPLVAAPLGASSVLLFGHPDSPLAQPRNLLLGNGSAAIVSVACVAWFGTAPWVMGLAVALAIAAGQVMRCLHPPAGAVALLGVLLHAGPGYVLMPVLAGSLLLLLVALGLAWLAPGRSYPHHWI